MWNALRRRVERDARLHKIGDISLRAWKDRLEERGYSVIYQQITISQSDVLLQKQAGLSRIVQEGKKIEGLIEKLAALNLGDVSRDQLGDLEARSISLRRELYDVVNSRPLYAPQR